MESMIASYIYVNFQAKDGVEIFCVHCTHLIISAKCTILSIKQCKKHKIFMKDA